MNKITVRSDRPVPPQRVYYPFRDMEVGQSFEVPLKAGETPYMAQKRIYSSIAHARKATGWNFRTKIDGKTLVVWRVEK